MDVALLAVRIALAWVFIYYGAAKLFGAFPGAGPHGIHETALLHVADGPSSDPEDSLPFLAGVTEFGGGIAMALGLCTRLAGLALFGDMVMAMITVTWATGINSTSSPPGYQLNLALAASGTRGGAYRRRPIQRRRPHRPRIRSQRKARFIEGDLADTASVDRL